MYSDQQVKEELERCVATACLIAREDPRNYPVKYMGSKKKDKNRSIKYAYYVNIQNFDSLNNSKQSQSDEYFRFIFRVILFRDRTELLYEIDKWVPTLGSIDNTMCVFRDDDPKRYHGDFLDHMVTIMKFCKYGF